MAAKKQHRAVRVERRRRPGVHALPRPRVGRARARRSEALRVSDPRGRASRPHLVDDPQQAGRLSPRVRGLRSGEGREVHAARVEKILLDPSIVRNRLKVEAAVNNARRFLDDRERVGSFDKFIWGSSAASRS